VQTVEYGECFNCWIPIHPVGVDRPSLQIVPGSHRKLRARAVDYTTHEPVSDEEIRDSYGKDAIATAILEPGDVLLFGHHTLHRTQPMDTEHPERVSAELRFTL
jgi:ectoine hydroxylase-related dioxygenase (phytanoyl-CoA dioxygenase family)